MSNKAVVVICCAVLALAAMAGLHLGVDYSGWVLFVALIGVLGS